MKKILSLLTVLVLLVPVTYFNKTAKAAATWSTFQTFKGNYLSDVTVDDAGNVYVIISDFVQKYTPNGVLITQWSEGGERSLTQPMSIVVDHSGYVYVADPQNQRIVKYKSNGAYVTAWSFPVAHNQFYPTGIALDSSGNIYAVDQANARIIKFKTDGTYLSMWDFFNDGNVSFYPNTLTMGPDGNLYVVDSGHARIVVLTPDGTSIKEFRTYVNVPQYSSYVGPYSVAVDAAGDVYATDYYQTVDYRRESRVLKFNSDGDLVKVWGSTIFTFAYNITVDHDGNVFVADAGNNRVLKMNAAQDIMISRAFKDAFGRAPTESDTTYWQGRKDWKTVDDLLKHLSSTLKVQGNEGLRQTTIKNAVEAVYGTMTNHDIAYWNPILLKDGTLYKDIVKTLQDLHQKDGIIQQAYQKAFGRNANPKEVKALIDSNKHQSISQLDTINRSTIMTDSSVRIGIINRAFTKVTGKLPDPDFMDVWIKRLATKGANAGMFYSELMEHFSNRNIVIAQSMLDVFGAAPTENDLNFYLGAANWNTKTELEGILRVLLKNSALAVMQGRESKNPDASIAVYTITSAYKAAFGQAPSDNDLNKWINQEALFPVPSTYLEITKNLLASSYKLYQRQGQYDYLVGNFQFLNDAITQARKTPKAIVTDSNNRSLWDNYYKYHLYQQYGDGKFHLFYRMNDLNSAKRHALGFEKVIIIDTSTGNMVWDNYFNRSGTDNTDNDHFLVTNRNAEIYGIGKGFHTNNQQVFLGSQTTPVTLSSLIAASGVVASGGGNVVAAGGMNVVASGGGNVVAAGGGNVVAAGGGNVVAAGGGNVVAAGGMNIVAPGGGN